VVVIPDGDVEERHNGIADVLVDEGAMLDQCVGRTSQEGVDNFVRPLWPELVRHFGEAAEVGKEHRQIDQATLFGVGVASVADIRVAVAAPDTEDAEERAQRPRQRGAANQAPALLAERLVR